YGKSNSYKYGNDRTPVELLWLLGLRLGHGLFASFLVNEGYCSRVPRGLSRRESILTTVTSVL
ncbi:MAG: hypothetical protein QXI19_04780, partial [Candidatus Caldarchaeum sp.]